MRTILHSDLNNFYASVECLRHPDIRTRPVVVVGSKEDRHGIVLAKNMIAKLAGVKTGDVYWEAKTKCGGSLVEIQADFDAYLQVSKAVRAIYADYTDRIEAYGIDECWLDLTSSVRASDGVKTAYEIKERIKREIGLTVSIGVSWNKIFAKLGSDMKKPDAVTAITEENYRQTVWTLPVQELLYVGSATRQKLNRVGIKTIGDLANADKELLLSLLGKWGEYLHIFANGRDMTPVVTVEEEQNIRSIGNSLTVYRDLENVGEVEMIIYLLSDAVASRMRETGLEYARTVYIGVRSEKLAGYGRQGKLSRPSGDKNTIAKKALQLFTEFYPWAERVRSVGISVSDFYSGPLQLDMFHDEEKEQKRKRLDAAIDGLRKKYGNNVIRSAVVSKDPRISELDIKGDHVIHPYSFFRHGSS